MQPTSVPFYADWTFWAFAIAAVAVVLSQLPPIRQWFAKGKLLLEVTDRVWVSHLMGYPNVQIFLSLRNIGGRQVRVRKITFDLERHGAHLCSVKAQSYFPKAPTPNEQPSSVSFTPITLFPNSEWAHLIHAYTYLVAKEDRSLGRLRASVRDNIGKKLNDRKRAGDPSVDLMEADREVLAPLMDLFSKLFVFEPGEYVLKLHIGTDTPGADLHRAFRFTLYDDDSKELRAYADDYKFGFGSAIDYSKHAGVNCELYPVETSVS